MSDTGERHPGLDAKLVAALDRLGEALAATARRAAEREGLSPVQMRLLLRLAEGPPPDPRVGALAREVGLTDPTVSEAVGALRRKGLVAAEPDAGDRRRRRLAPTAAGRAAAGRLRRWAAPVERALGSLGPDEGERALGSALAAIDALERAGVLAGTRMCPTCRHLRPGPPGAAAPWACALLGRPLTARDLRVDCAEHEAA